jgi:hypothetical protein
MRTNLIDPVHVQYLGDTLAQLCQAPKHTIEKFTENPLWLQHDYQSVYLVTDADDHVLYAGKTDGQDGVLPKEKAVADRIYGHTFSDSTVRTRLGVTIQVFKGYFVRVFQIEQAELRGAVELYAIAIFRPPGNRFYRK